MKNIFFLTSILFCFNAEAATKTMHHLNKELIFYNNQSIFYLKKDNNKHFLKRKKQVNPKNKKLHYSAKLAIFFVLPIFIISGILFNPIAFALSGIVFFTGLIIGIKMAKKYPEKYQAGWAKGLLAAGVMYALLFGMAFISIALAAE